MSVMMDIILDAGGNSNAQFFFTAGTGITFNNIHSITLTGGAKNCNVFWLAGADIKFIGTLLPLFIPIAGIFIAGSKITFGGLTAPNVSGRLYAQTANIIFTGTSSVDGKCTQNIVCYAKGTLILTKKGYVPIENIKAGDKIVTKGQICNDKFIENDANLKIEPVTWISKFKVHKLNSKSRPICIKKDALGENCPLIDLYVSPGHRLLLNGKMVLAKKIVNETTIYQDNDCNSVEYYHLECENHSAIFANGVLAESYLDVNNRGAFENSSKPRKPELKKIFASR